MNQGFDIQQGVYGERMVMTGPWSKAAAARLADKNVNELELNMGKGWCGRDVSFLAEFTHLQAFEILDLSAQDVSPVNHLTELRRINVNTYCKTEIDFSRFPHLEDCSIEWRPKAKSLFDTSGLKRLFINHYPKDDLRPLSRMANLEELILKTPRLKTLDGIESLESLKSLQIAAARGLQSLDGVDTVVQLDKLQIESCRKISDTTPLTPLTNLTFLCLLNMGEINSIKPLAGMQYLKRFHFSESTNVLDGDLSLLAQLPQLKVVSFQERRHYSHKRVDLPRDFGLQ